MAAAAYSEAIGKPRATIDLVHGKSYLVNMSVRLMRGRRPYGPPSRMVPWHDEAPLMAPAQDETDQDGTVSEVRNDTASADCAMQPAAPTSAS
jgi:hypothetical protein